MSKHFECLDKLGGDRHFSSVVFMNDSAEYAKHFCAHLSDWTRTSQSKYVDVCGLDTFCLKRGAKTIASHVKENRHCGIFISPCGGNPFVEKYSHIRACSPINIKYAIDLRKSMLANVITVSSDKHPVSEAFEIAREFLMAEPDMPRDKMIRKIKLTTHLNNPLLFYLWAKHPEIMGKLSKTM